MNIQIEIQFCRLSVTLFRICLFKERNTIPRTGFEILGFSTGNRYRYLFGYFLYEFGRPIEHFRITENYSKYHLTLYFLWMEFEFRIGNYANSNLNVTYVPHYTNDSEMPF